MLFFLIKLPDLGLKSIVYFIVLCNLGIKFCRNTFGCFVISMGGMIAELKTGSKNF